MDNRGSFSKDRIHSTFLPGLHSLLEASYQSAFFVLQYWLFGAANLIRISATEMKSAPGRCLKRIGHLPTHWDRISSIGRIRNRHCRDKCHCVWMQRGINDLVAHSGFNYFSHVHDCNAITKVLHHCQVMRDKEKCDPKLIS